MKILITGSNGFIAKNLIEHLKRDEESLEVGNHDTLRRLFGEAKASLPYSMEDGIKLMLTKR